MASSRESPAPHKVFAQDGRLRMTLCDSEEITDVEFEPKGKAPNGLLSPKTSVLRHKAVDSTECSPVTPAIPPKSLRAFDQHDQRSSVAPVGVPGEYNWRVVVVGRQPGLYQSEAAAAVQVKGVRGGHYRSFYGFAEAARFYDEQKLDGQVDCRWGDGEVPQPTSNIFQSGNQLSLPLPDLRSQTSTHSGRIPSSSPLHALNPQPTNTKSRHTPSKPKTVRFLDSAADKEMTTAFTIPDITCKGESLFRKPARTLNTPPRPRVSSQPTREHLPSKDRQNEPTLDCDTGLPSTQQRTETSSPPPRTSTMFSRTLLALRPSSRVDHDVADSCLEVHGAKKVDGGYLLSEERYHEFVRLLNTATSSLNVSSTETPSSPALQNTLQATSPTSRMRVMIIYVFQKVVMMVVGAVVAWIALAYAP